MKYIPTLIIEPRYDGKNIRVIVSGWGLGYDSGNMFRQEINVEWDWNAMISTICYERSKSALSVIEKVCTQKTLMPMLAEKEKILQRNVSVYEDLCISELLNNDEGNRLEALGDYSRLFALENTDIQHLANAIACAIGMTMVSFADLHYLVIDNTQPLFPTIAEMYFKDLADEKFREAFVSLYKNTYRRLSEEYPCMALQMQLEETMFIADLFGRKCITEEELAENIWRYCKSKGAYTEGGGKKLSAALSVLLSLKYTSTLAQKYLLCVEEILQNMNTDGRYTSELFKINIIKTDHNVNY